jgi:large subunit ribosomal protein L15
MPFKRGFTNIFRVDYEIINIEDLNDWAGGEVTPEALIEARMIRRKSMPVKVLGNGELTAQLTIHAHKFSASAREKIEAAGGSVVELPWVVERHSRSRGPNYGGRNAKKKAAQ